MSDPAAGKAARHITSHYFMTNLGLFGLLSTLAVSLTAAGFTAAQTGFLILVFTLTNKVAKVPLARWLDRISAASSVLLGCWIAAAGFVCLRLVGGLALTAVALAIAGLGVSVNALASKQLAAAASDRTGNRARLFSMVNIAVNVASAVAAPVALFFVNRHHQGYVLTGVSIVYGIAGLMTFLNYSRSRPDSRVRATGSSLRSYLTVLRLPGMASFMLINLLGWFCYGQLFNALALHVSTTLHATGALGWLYTINALFIVVAQLGVTWLTERLTGGRQLIAAVTSYALFALAFATIFLVPGYLGAVLGVVIFTLAEMMFVPTMDVLLLRLLGSHSRAIGYGLFSMGDAIGEGVGGGLGVAVYRWLAGSGHGREFWLVAAALALLAAVVTHRLRRTSAGLRALATAEHQVASTVPST
ncbi:MAG TPA: MFS transporter [Pseudonocardiaceae bacterium]|jgi:MFS family permease